MKNTFKFRIINENGKVSGTCFTNSVYYVVINNLN